MVQSFEKQFLFTLCSKDFKPTIFEYFKLLVLFLKDLRYEMEQKKKGIIISHLVLFFNLLTQIVLYLALS